MQCQNDNTVLSQIFLQLKKGAGPPEDQMTMYACCVLCNWDFSMTVEGDGLKQSALPM